MFEYFPDNYPWSLGVSMTLNCGGVMSEVDDACQPLRALAGRHDDAATDAWHDSWLALADRLAGMAATDERVGSGFSAGRKYRRACLYYFMAERQLPASDPRKASAYARALETFRQTIELSGEPVSWVEIPYEDGASLPALFVPARGVSGKAPCMVHFDGFDVTKELIWFKGIADAFAERGIATLIVDHPGVGEALRLRGLHQIAETEKPAGASVDWLAGRDDIDMDRVGIIALSLGGYFAPRAAAFEKRLSCCVAWGANWNFGERWEERFEGANTGEPSVSHIEDHFNWVFGKATLDETREITRTIGLQDSADKITCPLLVVHGENDRQVSLANAHNTIDAAVNAPRRDLKIFTLEDGGAEHCQADNVALGVDYMADWVAEVFGTNLAPA